MLDTWLPTITDADSYTDIIIELGLNDAVEYNETAFINGFNSAITKIKNKFVNANIHIGLIGKEMNNAHFNTRNIIISKLKYLSSSNNCIWINGNENILGGKYQTFDNCHPTTEGHLIIANAITSYMLGNMCPTCVLPENKQTGNLQGLEVIESYNDGHYTVDIHGTISNSSGIAIPGKPGIMGLSIGTVNLNYCYRPISVSGMLHMTLSIFGTTVSHTIPAIISILPSDDNSTTCSVCLLACYQDYYRAQDGSGQIWTDGFTFQTGIFNAPPATILA